jgi:hypothetical protein
MIQFLRKLRQEKNSKQKFTHFFLYALGEIFLVVVGILIAVQVNNWNENRKNALKEQTILTQLKKEYESNLAQLEEKTLMRYEIITTSHQILETIDDPKNIDEADFFNKIGSLTLDPTFDPITNDLMSSGNLQLIKNLTLKKNI